MTSLRTAERLTRLLAMLPWVIAHPGTTLAEIQERFGYQRDELLRDLNVVFVCGLPGYGPGDLMDATVEEDQVFVDLADYFSRPMRLTAAEGLMLLAAGLAVISSGAAPQALVTAVDKLMRVVAPDQGAIAVDLGGEPETVTALRRAATEGTVVNLTYTSLASGRTTDRDVEPWAVFATLGNWYLRGHCRLAGGERLFRVDRIRRMEPTGEAFEPPAQPPLPEVRYTPGVDDVSARIRLSPAAAWVADYYPVVVEQISDDGSRVVEFSAADPAVAARLMVRLGADAELLGGEEVAATTADLRRRLLARYGA